jgi:hypothetical protein
MAPSAYYGGLVRSAVACKAVPDLKPDEILEVEADRRRRVNEAFRLGSEASTAGKGISWAGPLAVGAAIAIAIALVLGVIALVR